MAGGPENIASESRLSIVSPLSNDPRRPQGHETFSSRSSQESLSAALTERRRSIFAEGRSFTLHDVRKAVQDLRDDQEVYPASTIVAAFFVAAACGLLAFLFHLAVRLGGCLSGLNGCQYSFLLDAFDVEAEWFKPVFYIVLSCLSGLLCSLALYETDAGQKCVGGGSVGTKLAVSSGNRINPWVIPARFFFATLYMGGGNTLGTEGPVIHLSTAMATNIVVMMGLERRKIMSIFGVIGAAAGISAAFGVLISGFIYVIEELTRTLSRKLALILSLASAVAMVVKSRAESAAEHILHLGHPAMVPDPQNWIDITQEQLYQCLLLALPIGVINGVAGWAFSQLAIKIQEFLNPTLVGKDQSKIVQRLFPKKSHLVYVGFISGCLGAIAYQVTGMNGVWGTNADSIPIVIKQKVGWLGCLILFVTKLLAFTFATAAGGPGGMLVPSLVAGGYLGMMFGYLWGGDDPLVAACGVLGMSSLFSSVMYMPVTGIVLTYELTGANRLVPHIVLVNFVSSNVAARLPHGAHGFVHHLLDRNPVWAKMGKQDFIETDEQEKVAKLGAQVAEKAVMELAKEAAQGTAKFELNGTQVTRIVETATLRVTCNMEDATWVMVQTKKTEASGKAKARNALPGSKQRPKEDAWTAAKRILDGDLPGISGYFTVRRDVPLEFNKDVKVSPSYRDMLTEYRNTFVEASIDAQNSEAMSRVHLNEATKVFTLVHKDGSEFEYTWYQELECTKNGIVTRGDRHPEVIVQIEHEDKRPSLRQSANGEHVAAPGEQLATTLAEVIPIMQALPRCDFTQIIRNSPVQTYKKGAHIVCQGDSGKSFYILLEGSCASTRLLSGGDSTEQLETIASGMSFGADDFFKPQRRSLNIVVTSHEATVLEVESSTFSYLVDNALLMLMKNHPVEKK